MLIESTEIIKLENKSKNWSLPLNTDIPNIFYQDFSKSKMSSKAPQIHDCIELLGSNQNSPPPYKAYWLISWCATKKFIPRNFINYKINYNRRNLTRNPNFLKKNTWNIIPFSEQVREG